MGFTGGLSRLSQLADPSVLPPGFACSLPPFQSWQCWRRDQLPTVLRHFQRWLVGPSIRTKCSAWEGLALDLPSIGQPIPTGAAFPSPAEGRTSPSQRIATAAAAVARRDDTMTWHHRESRTATGNGCRKEADGRCPRCQPRFCARAGCSRAESGQQWREGWRGDSLAAWQHGYRPAAPDAPTPVTAAHPFAWLASVHCWIRMDGMYESAPGSLKNLPPRPPPGTKPGRGGCKTGSACCTPIRARQPRPGRLSAATARVGRSRIGGMRFCNLTNLFLYLFVHLF